MCDPMWHVSSRSGVATLRTVIHLLLTYLLTYRERERSLFTMSEHNKYIYTLDNGRLPERNNHHKLSIEVCNQPHYYRNSHVIWDHTVLPATRQR